MKTNLKSSNITGKIIFSLIALSLTLTACKKDWGGDTTEASGIGFVHASPGAGALDIIVDNVKVNTTDFTYTKDIGYYGAYPGIRTFGVTKKDSLRFITTGNANLKPGSFYSIFVIDTLKSTSMLVLEDDLKDPETDKAKVRFINLSPDAASLDLAVQGQETSLFTAKAFKESTDFISIDPSDNYTFEVKESSTSTVAATLPAVKIEKGKIYTLWAKGLKNQTDSTKFGLSIMTNK